MRYPDGDVYIGTFHSSLFHGHGIRRLANGDMFEGQFFDGMQNGYGLYISVEEGWRYYGEYKKGMIYGKGICSWLDGTTYDGDVTFLLVGKLEQMWTGNSLLL